jgi:hypothetical protein
MLLKAGLQNLFFNKGMLLKAKLENFAFKGGKKRALKSGKKSLPISCGLPLNPDFEKVGQCPSM